MTRRALALALMGQHPHSTGRLVALMNRFCERYNTLVREMNQGRPGPFSFDTAREVSKAFHAIEKSGEWPNGRSK